MSHPKIILFKYKSYNVIALVFQYVNINPFTLEIILALFLHMEMHRIYLILFHIFIIFVTKSELNI